MDNTFDSVSIKSSVSVSFSVNLMKSRFNHKTNAEDVHFTLVSSDIESDDSTSHLNDVHPYDDESKCSNSPLDKVGQDSLLIEANNADDTDSDSSDLEGDPMTLEMIMVKNVKAGNEVWF